MLIKLAYLNLFRNTRRSVSTGLAICVGFVGLNLLGAYIYRIKKSLDVTSVYSALRGHVKVYKKDSLVQFSLRPKNYIFSPDEIKLVEKVMSPLASQVEYTGLNINGSGLLSNGVKSHPVLILSFQPEIYARSLSQPRLIEWGREWVLPSQIENIEIFRNNNDAMSVTPRIADIMNFKQPLKLNEAVQVAARNFDGDLNAVNLDLGAEHTTGVEFLEDTLVLIPYKKVQELLGTDGAQSISIYLKENQDVSEFKKSLDTIFKELPFPVETYFYYNEEINSVYNGTLGFLIVMGGFFVFLIGTAVSLTVINSLTMGIIERTKEIGTLFAVGFKKITVNKIFIYENLILSLISMIIGTALSLIISIIVNNLNIEFTPPGVSGKIQFRLIWNLYIAFSVGFFLFLLTWSSAWLVLKTKFKTKVINLLSDSGA